MSRIDTLSEYVLGSSRPFCCVDGIAALTQWPGQPLVRCDREDFESIVESYLRNEDPSLDESRFVDIRAILREYDHGGSMDDVYEEYLEQFPLIAGQRADAIFLWCGDNYPTVQHVGAFCRIYKETAAGFDLVLELEKRTGESWSNFGERAEELVFVED